MVTDTKTDGAPRVLPETAGDAPREAPANELLDEAKQWVQENETLAVLGAFAVGVFLGVLLRR